MSHHKAAIPGELADRLQRVFQLDAAPRTLDDLALADMGPFTDKCSASLVSATPTRHRVHIGNEDLHTYCVIDAFMLSALRGESAEIDSSDPETGEPIHILTTASGFAEDGPDLSGATVSFGVTRDGSGSVYSMACPLINLFATRANYERWSQKHPEALTLGMPLVDAMALARAWVGTGEKCC
jgi:hypothetical protein